MTMRRRLVRLEDMLPPPPPDEALRQKRWQNVVARFFRLVEQAVALLSPEEEQGVEKALVDLAEGDGLCGPYACWLRDLRDGWCRLPKLVPAAMKDLLVAWLTPRVNGGVVCKDCGLEFPHKNFTPLLAAWPGCASGEWDWAHLVRNYDRDWKELDGYVGNPIGKGGA